MTLRVSQVSVSRGSSTILDAVSFDAESGHVTGLIGPNGAGKSTLLRVLAGARSPSGRRAARDSGSVAVDGVDLAELGRRERARLVSLVEQETPADVTLRVRDVVALGRMPHRGVFASDSASDTTIIDDALHDVGMAEFAARSYDSLSGGERQRVQLARALAQSTDVLLLDEPTNHLDVHAQLTVLALLRARARAGATAVAVLHDLGLAATFCDRLVVLDRGRVVADGTPSEVLTAELLRTTYGVLASVLIDPDTGAPVIAYSGTVDGLATPSDREHSDAPVDDTRTTKTRRPPADDTTPIGHTR